MLGPSTPKAKERGPRSFTQQEKEKIVQLFDIELESRLNDLQAHLEAKLSNLVMYSNNQITRLPPSVRTVTLREFGNTYRGEINALVRGMASLDVLRNNPVPPSVGKRKRVEGAEEKDDDDARKTKTARQASASPRKPARTTQQQTPGHRTTSSSHRQFASRPPQLSGPSSHSYGDLGNQKPTGAPSSSARSFSSETTITQSQPFPHSSETFDPKTNHPLPVYPRQIRHGEAILSENGSPIANPFSLSLSRTSGGSQFSFNTSGSKEMKEIEREIAVSRIAVARGSSSTTETRSSEITAVNGRDSDPNGIGTFGSGLMLQIKTASGNLVAFDPLQTMPQDLEARDDLPKDDKKAIANAMLQFASTMKSWGSLASS